MAEKRRAIATNAAVTYRDTKVDSPSKGINSSKNTKPSLYRDALYSLYRQLVALNISQYDDVVIAKQVCSRYITNCFVNYNRKDGRLMFSRNKQTALNSYNIYLNGLIVKYKTSSIICVPPRIIKPLTQADRINIKNYDVFEAVDGTLVTLYYNPLTTNSTESVGAEWVLSTAHGMDMNMSSMFGSSKLMHTFTILSNINPALLDKGYCYSFILSHKDWHPCCSEESIRFVQSVNLKTFDVSYTKPKEFPSNVQSMRVVTVGNNGIQQLIDNAKRNVTQVGYVLRLKSSFDITSRYGNDLFDYFIESTKMQHIRKVLYQSVKSIRDIRIIALKQYLISPMPNLSEEAKTVYAMCGKFSDAINLIHKRFNILINRVINGLQHTSIAKKKPEVSASTDNKLDAVVEYYIKQIRNDVKILNCDISLIIKDIVIDVGAFDLYTNIFFSDKNVDINISA